MMPFLVEVQNAHDGPWEPRRVYSTEPLAQNAIAAIRAIRRIQGVREGEWRIIFVPKEGWE